MKEFWGFGVTLLVEIEIIHFTSKYIGKIDLPVHIAPVDFLSSMSTQRVALKLQKILICPL